MKKMKSITTSKWAQIGFVGLAFVPLATFLLIELEALRLGQPYVCCMPDNYVELLQQAEIARPHYESVMPLAYIISAIVGVLLFCVVLFCAKFLKTEHKVLGVFCKSFALIFLVSQVFAILTAFPGDNLEYLTMFNGDLGPTRILIICLPVSLAIAGILTLCYKTFTRKQQNSK